MNHELGKRIRKGDMKAFDLLYDQYSQRLYGFAFSMLKNKEDAKEIVQDTFLKLWNKRSEIDTSYSLKSFLFSISYNITVDLLRKRSKDAEFIQHLKTYFRDEGQKTDELVIFNELSDQLALLLNDLPEQRKRIYLMSREEGLGHREIADQLGIAVKTVENQINLALKHIRKNLGANSLLLLLFLSLYV